MIDEQTLIRSVCISPADDTPRLVFADWLDEHDQPERAEFIRLQCRIAEMITSKPCNKTAGPPIPNAKWTGHLVEIDLDALYEMTNRENYLIKSTGRHQLGRLPFAWRVCTATPNDEDYPNMRKIVFLRGFIELVHCSMDEFIGWICERCGGTGRRTELGMLGVEVDCKSCGCTGRVDGIVRELFGTHPVTSVTVTDAAINPFVDGFGVEISGFRGYRADMPKVIVDHLTAEEYVDWPDGRRWAIFTSSLDSARAALSAAFVAYGRGLVGLPPLAESPRG